MISGGDDLTAWDDPSQTALLFRDALLASPRPIALLQGLVLPERAFLWGDFSAAAELIDVKPVPRLLGTARRAFGARDVAYVYLRNDDDSSEQAEETYYSHLVAVITLVWRPDLAGWTIVTIGEEVRAENVPRTSLDVAP